MLPFGVSSFFAIVVHSVQVNFLPLVGKCPVDHPIPVDQGRICCGSLQKNDPVNCGRKKSTLLLPESCCTREAILECKEEECEDSKDVISMLCTPYVNMIFSCIKLHEFSTYCHVCVPNSKKSFLESTCDLWRPYPLDHGKFCCKHYHRTADCPVSGKGNIEISGNWAF